VDHPALSRSAAAVRSSVIRDLLHLTEQPHILSLAGGLPATEAFPVGDVQAATTRVLGEGPGGLQYSTTEGHPPLRTWIAEQCGHGVDPSQVLVTAGSQQALDLIARALLDPGDVVVIDDPGYLGAIQALSLAEPELVPVPVDGDGMRVDRLADLLAGGVRPKLCYTVGAFQNPTGATLADDRRRALADLADRYGFLVVEDDPYGHLRWSGTAPVALHAMTDRCVRLGTFSKIVAPGLRVGWLAAPPWLAAALVKLKQAADLHTSSLGQRIIADLVLQPGWFEAHVRRITPIYAERAAALSAALRGHVGDALAFAEPAGGMFVWAAVTGGGDAEALLRGAVDAGVAFVPGSAFAVDGRGHLDRIRLSFATLTPDDLDEAARRLAKVLL
jgi:2-aminoadipate transaminase